MVRGSEQRAAGCLAAAAPGRRRAIAAPGGGVVSCHAAQAISFRCSSPDPRSPPLCLLAAGQQNAARQEDARKEAEAEPRHPRVDPHAHWQHHSVRHDSSDSQSRLAPRLRGCGLCPIPLLLLHLSPQHVLAIWCLSLTLCLCPFARSYNYKRRHWRRNKIGL